MFNRIKEVVDTIFEDDRDPHLNANEAKDSVATYIWSVKRTGKQRDDMYNFRDKYIKDKFREQLEKDYAPKNGSKDAYDRLFYSAWDMFEIHGYRGVEGDYILFSDMVKAFTGEE